MIMPSETKPYWAHVDLTRVPNIVIAPVGSALHGTSGIGRRCCGIENQLPAQKPYIMPHYENNILPLM